MTSCGRYLPETLPILGHCSYLFQYCPLFRSHCCRTVPNMEVKKKYWLKSIKLTITGFCILIGFPCMEFTKSFFFEDPLFFGSELRETIYKAMLKNVPWLLHSHKTTLAKLAHFRIRLLLCHSLDHSSFFCLFLCS